MDVECTVGVIGRDLFCRGLFAWVVSGRGGLPICHHLRYFMLYFLFGANLNAG